MAKPRRAETIATTDFPLYTIRMVGDRHFLVAGGGGQAKTGVKNAFEIFELALQQGGCVADRVLHHATGDRAVMNGSVVPNGKEFLFVAGVDDSSQVFNLKFRVTKNKPHEANSEDSKLRQRRPKSGKAEAAETTVTFEVEDLQSFVTDFAAKGGFQKAVAFTYNHALIATGGSDGHLRVWQYPSLKKTFDVKAHTNEIDDLDITPTADKITTVSRDGHAYVWNTQDGKRLNALDWRGKSDEKYRFRCCRYGRVIDKQEHLRLFTTHIPCIRTKNPQPCFITRWNALSCKQTATVSAGTEILSSLAISDEGVYLGVGTISGSVSIYVAFSLQRLYHVREAHGIFVTGLDFVPSCSASRAVTGNADCSLISISADNNVKMHQVMPRGIYSLYWAIAGGVIFVYLIFWFIAAFQL